MRGWCRQVAPLCAYAHLRESSAGGYCDVCVRGQMFFFLAVSACISVSASFRPASRESESTSLLESLVLLTSMDGFIWASCGSYCWLGQVCCSPGFHYPLVAPLNSATPLFRKFSGEWEREWGISLSGSVRLFTLHKLTRVSTKPRDAGTERGFAAKEDHPSSTGRAEDCVMGNGKL